MRILVTGATGYIGGRLVPKLLEAGHEIRTFARHATRLAARFPNVEVATGDVFDQPSVERALAGIDVAYYLVHSMGRSPKEFAQRDREAAAIFAQAARNQGVKRIIYLGGLGDEAHDLSPHLRSRQEVGAVLRGTGVPVTEFRAAIIVGSGSVSFEMIRYLTERLPAMIAPRWVSTRCQPIAVRDVLAYLVQELDHPRDASIVYEIGGTDALPYIEIMRRYANIRGLTRHIVVVPLLTPRLSSAWVHLVTPIPSRIARPLIEGLASEVVVRNDRARRDFPIVPMGFDDAVRAALDRYEAEGPETTWFDAFDVRTLPGEFHGLTEGILIDRREVATTASTASLFRVFSGLGGKRGWLYANGLWELRGKLDRLVGGVGLKRGRRSADDLRIGDAVDFWRVEAYEPPTLLRLRDEMMKLPGDAWLQFEAIECVSGSKLRQTAFFEPRGALGYLYWLLVMPLHELIFGNMARRIAEEARRYETGEPSLFAASPAVGSLPPPAPA